MTTQSQVTSGRAEVRRVAEFHPSVWGGYFIDKIDSDDDEVEKRWIKQHQVLKEEVRKMLTEGDDEQSQKLDTIDMILRLGIGYHFEKEIEALLEKEYTSHQDHEGYDEGLYTVALRFRLLRQQGYNVPSDAFKNFMDGKDTFKESIMNDAKGLLSLYEASYLAMHGEDILDKALTFTKTRLESMPPQLDSLLANQVRHALKRPLHRSVVKYEQYHYISIYQQDKTRNEAIVKLSKLDFNILQKMYQKELTVLSKWWRELDFKTKLPFGRDRLIELYFWAVGTSFEPQFVNSRWMVTKILIFVSYLDDMYDVHGTIQELEHLTQIIDRWDTSMKGLPEYMKVFFEGLIGFVNEIGEETIKEGRPHCVHFVKEAEKDIARAYITEARWFNGDCVPTVEEYRHNGLITSTAPLIAVACLCGMGKIASKEIFDWLFTFPKILSSSCDVVRLMNDIVSHEFEQERGHVASSVECYRKQYGVSTEKACAELNKLVERDWKDLNEELLKPTAVPKIILEVFIKILRIADVVYEHFDGYTESRSLAKDIVEALFVNPMFVEA